MAQRLVAIGRIAPGLLALALVLGLIFGCLALVLLRAGGVGALTPADMAALRFTLLQAILSALFSTLIAVPIARALARRRFAGRTVLVTALGAPFILPVLVATLGILAIFGRAGLLNQIGGWLGLPALSVYGLQGVLLAHLFLNLPLAVRMILNGWAAIPPERFRLATALDLAPRDIARLIERPMLRATLPGCFLAIFLVCLASFTVILIMGGGPRATSLGLAIYQAFRLDFNLPHAASLAALQTAVSLGAALAGLALTSPAGFGAGRGLARMAIPADPSPIARAMDATLLLSMTVGLALPLAMAVGAGLPALAHLPPGVGAAALRSGLIAVGATLLALGLSLPIGLAIVALRPGQGRLIDAGAMLALTTSPLVLGTGLFLALRPWIDPATLALPITALVNAIAAMPFCLRILMPELTSQQADYGRLSDSLDMRTLTRLRLVTLPRLRPSLGYAAGLSAALSMGDLGVITLFSDPDHATLPMVLFRLMGQYRMDQAYGVAVILMALSLLLFLAFDRMGRTDADA
jgi:thiamine transport system permease protein